MTFTREQARLLEDTHEMVRLPVKAWTPETAVEQVRKCGFECEGGPLENNDAWRWIVMTLTGAANINECPSCNRMFVDGETCSRGGCPMGGDV